MSGSFAVAPADIDAARARIRGHVLRTPLILSPRLSELLGTEVLVKHENMHATASFKERGAANKLLQLSDDERARVAYHARRFGIPATIVMPETTPLVKVENTRAQGAKIVLYGETLHESGFRAREIAKAQDLVLIHPYDDPAIMAGQGTVALEMLEDAPDLDVIIIPLGGGGLMAANAIAAWNLRPGIEMIGAETEMFPAFLNALNGEDRPVGGPTLAEGIAVKTVGELTLPVIRELVTDVIPVSEDLIEHAVSLHAGLHHTMAEGAGAVSLAAMLKDPARFSGRRVGLVLSGGNIDTRLLAAVMMRDLERADRIVSLRLTSNDYPGLLGRIASLIGSEGANILEVRHSRQFLDLPAKGVSIDLTIETRGGDHVRMIETTLLDAGFTVRRIRPQDFAKDVLG
ncbi:threonine ammonia-lyase [Pontibaca methylaminivorans]|uniref:threonine ammonia-lyase n=1 Tax=Pontibaca methylaminivorans TaxID=515897 RepID=UPI002FDB4FC4